MDEQNRNLLLATALSFAVILIWFLLFPPPEQAPGATGPDGRPVAELSEDGTPLTPPGQTGTEPVPGAGPAPGMPNGEATPEAARVAIETPSLTGTINTVGGRIDDLLLDNYRETLEDDSPLVRLFEPTGSANPYYALHGWIALEGAEPDQVPGDSTVWQIAEGETLTPDTPVTLIWDNGAGLVFRKSYSVDENFMFSVTQSVENTSGGAVTLRPYGQIRRHGQPDTVNFFILHEGVVRMSDGELEEIDYDDLPGLSTEESQIEVAENGWVGFTDKYWMSTLIPSPGSDFRSVAREVNGIYLTESVYNPVTVAPGASLSADSQLFAGAKEWATIREYESEGGIDRFIDSIDWGWFFFLTKPIFAMLHWFNAMIGNMGWAIILLTLVIKAILFPLAYKSYSSMAKMKELQPEMEKLKERAGDDKQKLQQGMMELYKKNKVNPASGCLPILLQIPIFFSLYKVIFVTLELRHAPFVLWIKDLSAPDPSSLFNLFGLLPWAAPEPGSIMALVFLGILPILLGASMWLQMKLNPAPPDPTQRMIFAWMPWIFMFMLGSFASGLLVYWIANNMITFTQQYLIMRAQGYKPDLLGNIRGSSTPPAANKSGPPKK